MNKFLTLFAAATVVMTPAVAKAQTQAATATVTVSDILTISINNPTIAFGSQTSAGVKSPTGNTTTTVSYSGNTTHTVRLKADTEYFNAVVAANDDDLPASRLEVQVDAGAWGAIDNVAYTPVATSVPAGTGSKVVSYRLTVNALDPKDTYSLGMTYEIIAG